MAKFFILLLLVRVLLPVSLLISIALRPFGLSCLYLLLFLLSPLVPIPGPKTIKGLPGQFLFLNVVVSTLLLVGHVIFHSTLAGFAPYGSLIKNYPLIEKICQNLGFYSFRNVSMSKGVWCVIPEVNSFISSITIYTLAKRIVVDSNISEQLLKVSKNQKYPMLTTVGKYVCLFLIMFAGIMRPSITSGIYYLVFMASATAWSLGRHLERGFATVCRCLSVLMVVHVAILFCYQCTWIMDIYPPERNFARYFGLTRLVIYNGNGTETFEYSFLEDQKWGTLASPLVILITYYFLVIETRELFKPKVVYSYINSKALRGNTRDTDTTPLISSLSPSKRRSFQNRKRNLRQDSTGSVIMPNDDDLIEDIEPTLMDEIIQAIIDFFKVMVRSSYIATTITMMAWSIMYHSWLTFVFLMWANVVWLWPNQRTFMLKTSPLLVFYAMLLLLAQYIYGMNLTKDELPSEVPQVNLNQIGLSHPMGEACLPLLVKSLFTCMFWVTLRQRWQDFQDKRRAAVVTDMAAPLQLTVSTAASVLDAHQEEEKQSRLLKILGEWLRAACAHYWIYVVVIMLFVIGITGDRMTIFRIIYMLLFLVFILMFQFSWYWWRRLIYVFWIVVIIYSMVNLILIYVYQFDNFSKMIEQYLLVNEKLQHDLGLDTYNPAHLFVKLLTPTLFLIITVMQVHYFHKDFLALSDPATRHNSMKDPESSRQSGAGASTMNNDVPQLPLDALDTVTEADHSIEMESMQTGNKPHNFQKKSVGTVEQPSEHRSHTFRDWLRDTIKTAVSFFNQWVDNMFLYLEIHLIKIIMVSLMLLCVSNVSAIHVPIMIIITPGLLLNRKHQRFCVLFISLLISIYLMATMVYQIGYIRHSYFDCNCTVPNENETMNITTFNNAVWFGFKKASSERPLVTLTKGYIGLMAVITFYSLVTYRQRNIRKYGLLPDINDNVIFPEVKRVDADKDVPSCLKFFVNYGFYKFGVEVTLICLMGVIGSRMDAYSVIYAGWLVLMITSPRTRQARFWGVFTAFITFIIPFQYMLAVGFMPQFCIQYPWSGEGQVMRHVRSWFFLPYMAQPPHAAKLIFDYFLLLFASRQLQVFNIEKNQGSSYAGGCNKENIGADWETPFFVNPVPDFIGTVGNWLDVVKRTVFLTMLWVTLAIMFMAGTNRVNLFSMGYLIGSFVFFWQGSDFYLLPKPSILRWWSWLLIYNVAVVVLKTLLQVPGCIFGHVMQEHACWVVQLLGIGCVDKFAGGNIKHFLKMQYVKEASCPVPQEDIGLAWDGVCFAFLLLQRRLFHSYYFFRVIDESKATTVLASRGAELIEELRVKQMRIQEEQELKILEKIKAKMEKIKANQKRIQGFTKEPLHHDRGSEPGPDGKRRVYTKRHEAVRSGDYYMFDDIDDTEIQFKSDEEKEESDDELPKDMGLGKTQPSSVVHEGDVAISERAGPSDIDDYAPEPAEPETWFDKLKHILVTVWALVDSFLVSATRYVMRYSRDYRYVSNSLAIEKKRIKEKDSFGIGLRQGVQMRWEPLPDTLVLKDVTMLEEHDESVFKHEQPSIVHLVYATWYAVLAHTEIVCYIMVFINQIQSATILSIPLPLMVFLWGTLSIPRPTKTFWVTMIAYTEVIVLIKSMFQFEILPWNQKAVPANMPFTAPRIIGIERKAHYALYDLILLLLMFFHRFMLKSLGLWKESLPEVLLHDDFDYPVTKEDTQMLVEGRGSEVGRKYVVLHDMEGPREERVATAIRDEARGLSSQQSSSNDQDLGGDSGSKDGGGGSRDLDPENQVDEEADDEPVIAVRTTLENPYQNYMNVLYLALKRYIRPITNFFHHMTRPGARVTSDVYAYMFLCDFVNFLVVIFGFAAFGTHQGDGGVQAYLEENKVPIPFLIMLILQFALIIIDRALYLRKYMLGKILFQYGLIIGVHIWMFFVLPFITERNFNTLLAPPMWYMMKCIYLLLSAYQIRCGYPRRIIGNFLCKSYNFVNMVLFRGFMVVPFVFELRTLMDWIWTDTSMTLMDWLKMEDIFASVYLLKCSRNVEDEFPQARGVKKSNVAKYLLGGSVLTFVIAIIWFPLVFFAFGNTVGRPNPPTDVTVKIRIGPFLPVYQMSAQSHNIDVFTEQDYLQLNRLYARDRSALTFLSTYMFNDVAVISINPNSTMKWQISPPELERLEREAASNSSLTVKFTFVITHPSNAQNNPPVIEDSQEVSLDAFANDERNPEREVLYNMLVNQAKPTDWVNVKLLFPKFIKVFNKGTAKPAYQLMPESSGDPLSRLYRDVQLRLERQSNSMYWRVREKCTSGEILNSIPLNDCSMLVMYTFNDKLFPETLNFISGSGIIGLYTTFVFLAARVIRGFFSGIYTKIMFDDLPNVDRVLQLCLDIYLVREAIELTLEEDLFAKLVFLYRSPETMIKWTRPREDLEEQRALPPP